jgi:Tol biopolymer transport system component
VYRARDTRLNRDVALKVLPELVALDADRLARFKREAQLLAALNHPNISAIYGIEESPAEAGRHVLALVLELVDGPTLADRIAQGPVPLDEALPIARQMADALEAAHEQGVIHRDLKPANVKLRPDGMVKVLDFGLAKALEGGAAPAPQDPALVSQSPTLSVAATRLGVILGTAAYMAPEQAKGKAVDKRADIWAFGCVLYEMLTGRRAFDGEDISEILASVIKGSANLDLLPAGTPPRLREVVARCLEKDVRKRFRDMGDVGQELERVQTDPRETPAALPGARQVPARPLHLWIGGAVAVTALLAGGAVWMLKPATPFELRPTARFVHTLAENQQFRNTGRTVVAVSPDGRQFVYNTNGGLYLRSLDGLTARLVPGTEGTLTNPFFSPDGQWIGFYAGEQLRKIPVAGGTAVALGKAINPFGASWGPDDTILFGQPEGIVRVSADGGMPELVIATEKGEQIHGPQMLPGGQWVLFSIARGTGPNRWDVAEIVAQSLASGERKVLWRGGSDARYVPTGHLVYALGEALFALPFDLDRVEVSGGPVPVLDGLRRAPGAGTQTGTAHYGLSDDGTVLYVAGGITIISAQARTLVWVDRKGREEAIAAPPRAYLAPRLSPDGTQVAVDVRDQENDVWIWSLARHTLTRLTFDPGIDRYPVWTPDGRRIVFSSQRAGASNIFWQAADGTGAVERLTEGSNGQFPTSVSADGTKLVFDDFGPSQVDIRMMALDGDRRAAPLVATTFFEYGADLSADGRWMAYQSNESGRFEVYVRPFPNVDGGRWQVSTGGGTQPRWAPNSRELFYVDAEGRIAAVAVQPGPGFVAGNPQVVVDGAFATLIPGFSAALYDVSRDGQRFLLLKGVEGAEQKSPPPHIVVVTNWFEELRRRVPEGR